MRQVNKFEQVSSDDHQMPLSLDRVCQEGVGYVIYHATYPMVPLVLPTTPCEQTDACKNITHLCEW